MTPLTLGIEGLESAELSRVRILLRLLKGNPHFHWTYAAEGPFDALLCANPEALARSAVVIDVLPTGSARSAGTLVRPIEAANLEALLMQLQNQLQPTVFGGLEPELGDIFASFAETHAGALDRVPPLTPALLPAPQAGLNEAAAEPESSFGNEEYRLKRWPPQAVLRDSKDRIRLANLISRKSFSIEQLVQSSGISQGEVQAFITVLQSFGIVNVAQATVSASVPRLSTATCAAPRQKQKRSFLSAIRRKLGI
ncbi:MAG: hypothetical protein U5L73_07375 [Rhodoferax sp.]|uniref:hypothetical protein n=1 Tax=Rhodoferax sp. TaxID=50421 RepID=UPI002ACE5C31|nr:hypothetical protein [Rhodoferax sp.]MDZ7891565.1 hypothetical protein [Rhodoferax sp.]